MCPIDIGDDVIRTIPEQVAKNTEEIGELNQKLDQLKDEVVEEATAEIVADATDDVIAAATPLVVAEARKYYSHNITISATLSSQSSFAFNFIFENVVTNRPQEYDKAYLKAHGFMAEDESSIDIISAVKHFISIGGNCVTLKETNELNDTKVLRPIFDLYGVSSWNEYYLSGYIFDEDAPTYDDPKLVFINYGVQEPMDAGDFYDGAISDTVTEI